MKAKKLTNLIGTTKVDSSHIKCTLQLGSMKKLNQIKITMGEFVSTFEHTILILVWVFLNFFHTWENINTGFF